MNDAQEGRGNGRKKEVLQNVRWVFSWVPLMEEQKEH